MLIPHAYVFFFIDKNSPCSCQSETFTLKMKHRFKFLFQTQDYQNFIFNYQDCSWILALSLDSPKQRSNKIIHIYNPVLNTGKHYTVYKHRRVHMYKLKI